MDEIIQLKITLKWTKPPIWRRVLVDRKSTFYDLHNIIQIAMGWTNSHLYEFKVFDYRIGEPNEEFDETDFGGSKIIDASTVLLDSILTDPKEKFVYEYDFGDSWTHSVVVEKFLPADKKVFYPTCIAGKLKCPPEDCGGVSGFYGLLEILNNKRHPDREDMMYWVGGSYDSNHFDIEWVNDQLSSFDTNE